MNNMESNQPNGNSTGWAKNHRHLTAGKLARIIGWVFVGVVVACFFALIFGLLVQWLWGVTLAPLFNLPRLTYWQAVGLIILAKLLFGGVGHPHKDSDHSFRHKKWHDRFEGFHRKNDFSSDRKNSNMENGEYYREFWEKEGKKAFEDFLDKRRPTTGEQNY
jgi:hypothetical protein